MLERYEGALHRADKEKDYGTLRVRGPIGWLKKKSSTGDRPKDKKGSFLLRARHTRVKVPFEPHPDVSPDEPTASPEATVPIEIDAPHRERLSQQRLQEQIQLLRTLHQHQYENFKEPDHQYNTMEFASTTTNATPLAKSISMPSIIRGMSMANFKNKS
jgi:hypothetical protein